MLQFIHEDACRTPMLQVKKHDSASAVNATLALSFSYMFLMTSNNFPEIPDASILNHKVDLFIMASVFVIINKTAV